MYFLLLTLFIYSCDCIKFFPHKEYQLRKEYYLNRYLTEFFKQQITYFDQNKKLFTIIKILIIRIFS